MKIEVLNIIIWTFQSILAIIFLMAGILKITQTREKLISILPWVTDFQTEMVRFIGISELLGAIGLIIPMLLDFYPGLTPIAAVGLAIIMVLATLYHLRKRQLKNSFITFTLMILSIIVASYRFMYN